VYEGNGTDLSDVYLENNKEYFYALFAVDLSSNYSAATTISARPKAGATQATEVGTKPTLTNTPTPPTTNPGGAGTLLVKGPFAVGYRTEEVKILQTLLASDPSVYPEALVTGYYGEATVRAVQKFQSKYGIISSGSPTTTGYGLAGPATRAKINEVLGSGGAGRIVTVPGVGQVDLDNITAEQQTLIINTLQQIILDLTKQIATLISARVN
jgi:peptidoglycan hydrolase-like protein with peptidoglycan-binding domain